MEIQAPEKAVQHCIETVRTFQTRYNNGRPPSEISGAMYESGPTAGALWGSIGKFGSTLIFISVREARGSGEMVVTADGGFQTVYRYLCRIDAVLLSGVKPGFFSKGRVLDRLLRLNAEFDFGAVALVDDKLVFRHTLALAYHEGFTFTELLTYPTFERTLRCVCETADEYDNIIQRFAGGKRLDELSE